MRNPWEHDRDDVPTGTAGGARGRRGTVRLGVVMWLLVGVAVVGLYVGWSIAPRESADVPTATTSGVILQTGPGSMTLLFPVADTTFGIVVDLDGPRVAFVVAGRSVVLV